MDYPIDGHPGMIQEIGSRKPKRFSGKAMGKTMGKNHGESLVI
jgi:hypothetical protein